MNYHRIFMKTFIIVRKLCDNFSHYIQEDMQTFLDKVTKFTQITGFVCISDYSKNYEYYEICSKFHLEAQRNELHAITSYNKHLKLCLHQREK